MFKYPKGLDNGLLYITAHEYNQLIFYLIVAFNILTRLSIIRVCIPVDFIVRQGSVR